MSYKHWTCFWLSGEAAHQSSFLFSSITSSVLTVMATYMSYYYEQVTPFIHTKRILITGTKSWEWLK